MKSKTLGGSNSKIEILNIDAHGTMRRWGIERAQQVSCKPRLRNASCKGTREVHDVPWDHNMDTGFVNRYATTNNCAMLNWRLPRL